ncbi:MAG: ATP/GTP-binding protein [Candidatus Korarchaeota archaeon]
MKIVYIVGPAGSGKSSLAAALQVMIPEVMEKETAIVNLDPAVGELPYYPDVDIRRYVNIGELMKRMILGPNGAMVEALERCIDDAEFIQQIIDTGAEIAVIDAPGQLEPFVFRPSGPVLIKSLPAEKAMIFTMDPIMVENARDMLSLLLLATSVSYRLAIPRVFAVTKIDLFSRNLVEEFLETLNSPEKITAKLYAENENNKRFDRDFVMDLSKLLVRYMCGDVFPLSSKTYKGIDTLIAALERILYAP